MTNLVALLGDTHFGIKSDSPEFFDYQMKFYNETFFPYLEERGIKHVVQFGDFFDRRKFVNYNLLRRVKNEFLNQFAERGITMDLFLGNHDVAFTRSNRTNSFDLVLQGVPNIVPYTQPATVKYGGVDVALLPWINEENLSESLTFINETPAKVLFGHLELAGFETLPGHVMQHGMSAKLFDRFDLTLSGHYHGYSEQGSIVYLGIPYQLTWADHKQQKGFWTFDLDNPTRAGLEFVPNPHLMFYRIRYDDSVTDYDTIDVTDLAGKIVVVGVHTRQKPDMYERFIDRIYKTNPLEISTEELALDYFERNNEVEHTDQTTPQLIEEYIDLAPDKSYDKGRLKHMMADLYNRAVLGTENEAD